MVAWTSAVVSVVGAVVGVVDVGALCAVCEAAGVSATGSVAPIRIYPDVCICLAACDAADSELAGTLGCFQ